VVGRKEQIWTTKHKRRKIHEQKHRLAGEEEGRSPPHRSPPTEGAAPPGRRSTPGERRRTPRISATELTSTTVPQREWSVERRRRAERGRRGFI